MENNKHNARRRNTYLQMLRERNLPDDLSMDSEQWQLGIKRRRRERYK